ncbi:MAG: chitinase, partial [Solirubrobacterales bacterium]
GYDWSSNGTKAYGINGMYNLAAANNAAVLWDDISKSPYFSYTDASGIAHNDWFENSQSVQYKLDLVTSYNLSGISIWRLGLENPDYWTSIKTKLNR